MKLKIIKLVVDVELYQNAINVSNIAASNSTNSRVDEATRSILINVESNVREILDSFNFQYEDNNTKFKFVIHETQDGISSYSYYTLVKDEIIRIVLNVRVSNHTSKRIEDANVKRLEQTQKLIKNLDLKLASPETLDIYFKNQGNSIKIYISMSGESSYTEVSQFSNLDRALRGKIRKMLSKYSGIA